MADPSPGPSQGVSGLFQVLFTLHQQPSSVPQGTAIGRFHQAIRADRATLLACLGCTEPEEAWHSIAGHFARMVDHLGPTNDAGQAAIQEAYCRPIETIIKAVNALWDGHVQLWADVYAAWKDSVQATDYGPFQEHVIELIRVQAIQDTDVERQLAAYAAVALSRPADQGTGDRPPAPKRSTERGEGRSKLIGALTKHHQYADGGCLNLDPIGNNELAKLADVSPSTASAFFNNEFQGHTKYKALSRDAGRLVAALKLLNNEFSPHNLYGGRPADEGDEGNLK